MDFEIIKPLRAFLHPQVFLKKVACANHHEQNFLATLVNTDIPFRYIALQPAHEKLLPLYLSIGFKPLDKTGWLFFKINQ